MSRSATLRDEFAKFLEPPDAEVDLLAAAFHIARIAYPDLDIALYLDKLDRIGEAAAARLNEDAQPYARIEAVNHHLYGELGFAGNSEDYYDPRNSFLNDVIDRRTGIPITLAMVYLDVARHAGLPLVGISMPGHFLLCYAEGERDIFVDAYERGIVLTRAECTARLQQIYGDEAELTEAHLKPVGPREILGRMLNNLRSIYIQRSEWDKALTVVEWSQVVTPYDILLYRESGALAFQLGLFAKAEEAWDEYLRRLPDAPDAKRIREALLALRQTRHHVN